MIIEYKNFKHQNTTFVGQTNQILHLKVALQIPFQNFMPSFKF